MRPTVLLLACLLLWPAAGLAQGADPFTSARVHIGPFALTPSFTAKDVGVDTNVFYDYVNPKSDFTATLTPGVDTWMRFGKARLNAKFSATYLYFAKYSDQRSAGTTDSVRLQFAFVHLQPWAAASLTFMRDRPGYEITTRLRHTDLTLATGADAPLTSRTTFGVSFNQTRTTYASGEAFLGVSVRDALARHANTGGASVRYALTPLTTFVLTGEVVQERFDYNSLRNSDGVRVMPGLEFDASALVTGSARVGIHRFRPLTEGVPGFTGLVSAVDLGYALKGVTRFVVQVSRDVAYSYDSTEPYYLLTSVNGSVTQAVGGPWSVMARAGVQRLAYQQIEMAVPAAGAPPPGRVDMIHSYGAGVGYRLNATTTVSLNADYNARTSGLESRQLRGLRIGTTVIYGY